MSEQPILRVNAPQSSVSIQAPLRLRASRLTRIALSVTLLGGIALSSITGTGLFPLKNAGNLLASSAFADEITPHITQYTLPTGQNLFIKVDHSRPIVTIDTWVKTGSVNETPPINGVSHFLEHLLFKGTDTYKAGQIDRMLEARGSEFNAATSDDFTHFYITSATPYFSEALKLHADMMVNAAVPETELKPERKVVQEEINRANDNPDRLLYIEMAKLMYGTHGYGYDTLGPKENIATIPREKIMDYYHYWYQPKNFNTVVVGDVDPEQVKAMIEKAFPGPSYQMPQNYSHPTVGAVQPPSGLQVKVVENPNITQAYIGIGLLGPAQQVPDDVYALDIATLVLGSGKSSRLYDALVEKNSLATSVDAGNNTQKYAGLVLVNAEAKPDNRMKVVQGILKQLESLRQKGITQEELDKAKTQYLKAFVFENETTDGTSSSIGYNVTIGSLDDYLNHVANVRKVTLEQVQTALNKYLDLNKAVLVELLPATLKADPVKEKADLTDALNKSIAALNTTPPELGNKTEDNGSLKQTHGATAAEAAKSDDADSTAPQKKVLPNGLTLIMQPLKDSQTVAVKVFAHGGDGVETKPGLASLMASTMMQGTHSRSAEAISQELESKGMSLSVSSDDDYVELTGNAIEEDFGSLFNVLEDVLSDPTFTDAQINKKKTQIKQAIDASRDTPSAVAFENLTLALYPHHPYGNQGKRVEAALPGISRSDVENYYHRIMVPSNMIVSLVGHFDPATATNYFASLKAPTATTPTAKKPAPIVIAPVPAIPKDVVVTEEKPSLSATWMALGWLAPPIRDQKDYAALKVMNTMIGTGMTSRLFVDLREKQGLAYVVGSMYPSRKEKSRFVLYIGTDPVNTDKVKAGFKDEIERIRTVAVTEDELKTAKSKLIGGFALAHDTNVNQAYYLGLYETIGVGFGFDRTYPDLINKVTAADIQRVANTYLGGPSVFSIIQPGKTATASKKEADEPAKPITPTLKNPPKNPPHGPAKASISPKH